jgi:hypothetical protein
MSFIEFESWEIAEGNEDAHHQIIRDWFAYVRTHHADLFAEWKSTRYYRQIRPDGQPTGRYVMLFEYHTLKGRDAYKERRKNWDGPYTDYKQLDPYHLFLPESVRVEYWEPQEQWLWFEFGE